MAFTLPAGSSALRRPGSVTGSSFTERVSAMKNQPSSFPASRFSLGRRAAPAAAPGGRAGSAAGSAHGGHALPRFISLPTCAAAAAPSPRSVLALPTPLLEPPVEPLVRANRGEAAPPRRADGGSSRSEAGPRRRARPGGAVTSCPAVSVSGSPAVPRAAAAARFPAAAAGQATACGTGGAAGPARGGAAGPGGAGEERGGPGLLSSLHRRSREAAAGER